MRVEKVSISDLSDVLAWSCSQYFSEVVKHKQNIREWSLIKSLKGSVMGGKSIFFSAEEILLSWNNLIWNIFQIIFFLLIIQWVVWTGKGAGLTYRRKVSYLNCWLDCIVNLSWNSRRVLPIHRLDWYCSHSGEHEGLWKILAFLIWVTEIWEKVCKAISYVKNDPTYSQNQLISPSIFFKVEFVTHKSTDALYQPCFKGGRIFVLKRSRKQLLPTICNLTLFYIQGRLDHHPQRAI